MKNIQQFFTQIDSTYKSHEKTLGKITISNIYQKSEYDFMIDDQNRLIVKAQNKSLFIVNQKCRMQPKYIHTKEGQQLLETINLHDTKASKICLTTEKEENLKRIYNSLNLFISHQGFNQYYKPLRRLGKGSFATVYLVQNKITKQRMAAKLFSKQGQKVQFKGKESLQTEIKVLRQLDHPNMIKYYGVYETDNLLYLITEYLPGGTLEQRMRAKGTLSGEVIIKVISEALKGLSYLSSKGIMHRDIKPENIIYRQTTDQWVICDFGLAAWSSEDYLYDRCGTMGFIAPEIMSINEQNQHKYGQECDMYSLGIIAYNLIVGHLPFKVDHNKTMFDKKIVWDLFNKKDCEGIHSSVLQFLRKILENDPKKRISPQEALKNAFFTNNQVVESLVLYHDNKLKQRHQKILQMANIN